MDPRRRQAWMLFPLLLVPWALLVRRYWFLCDDAFITFRYSRNWAQGFGPRYNLGEHVPVEGYSDFLWMAIAAVVEAVGSDVRVVMPWLSVLCAGTLLALVHRTMLRHVGASATVASVTTLILGTFVPFTVWSTSGLETMPQALLMYATWMLLALEEDDRRVGVLAGITALCLALVRTEGVAWAVVIAGVASAYRLLEGRSFKQRLVPYVGILVAGFGAYWLWRFSYYESLVANTAYAKVHMQPSTLVRGLSYIAYYAAVMGSPILLALSLPVGLRSERRNLALAAGAMAVGVPAYAVVVSGDYMAFFRILVPGAAFMVVSFGIALQVVAERGARARNLAHVLALATAALGVLPAFELHITPAALRAELDVRDKLNAYRDENGQWEAMRDHTNAWREKGQALARYAQPGDTFVAAAIGNVGYYSNVFIYDRNGLVTREVAMQEWNGRLRSPGHDKTVEYDFFLDMEPSILDAKLIYGPRLPLKIKFALKEMDAFRNRKAYYPEVFELESGKGPKRILLPLRRAASEDDAEAGWERFQDLVKEMKG